MFFRFIIHVAELHTRIDQLYAQVNKKRNTKNDAVATNPTAESDEDISQLYAQVDKKSKTTGHNDLEAGRAVDPLYTQVDKKANVKYDAVTTNPTAESDADVSQLYAQVDKKSMKKGETIKHNVSEAGPAKDQHYAQVDKKQCRNKATEVSEDSTEESGAVYSVVNKPKAPQLPPKSDLLMEELNKCMN